MAPALAALQRQRPRLRFTTREGTTPSLVRALRAGTIDLALLTSRPPHRSPDADTPALHVEPLLEDELVLAAPDDGRYAGPSVTTEHISGETWIASPSHTGEPLLGVWPGLPGRPLIHHAARDWLTKLHLVAAGIGITSVPATLRHVLPPGVRLLTLDDAPPEQRRINLVRLPAPPQPPSKLSPTPSETKPPTSRTPRGDPRRSPDHPSLVVG